MALVGAGPQFTYGHNHWSALFATAPATLSTAGVPLPDGNRLVVEFAKITPANIDNSPAVTWTDITARVTNLSFLAGDPNGSVSRPPVESIVVTTADLTDLLGDFVELGAPSTGIGPCPGSFLRWGIVNMAGPTWQPRQSCIVETITDLVAGRVRGWQIQAFGTLSYFARFNFAVDNSFGVGTNLNTCMATVCSLFGDGVNAPWPWAETFAAQDGTMPTLLNPTIAANTFIPKLQFLNQLADSQGMRVVNDRTGGLKTEAWTTTVASTVRVSDEPASTVAGHAPIAGTIAATLQWVRSEDRTAGSMDLPVFGASQNDLMYTKWFRRSDVRSNPWIDTRSVMTVLDAAKAAALITAFVSQIAYETRLDHITVDTAADRQVWAMLTATTPVWVRSKFTAERRRPGTTWLETPVVALGVSGVIEFSTGIGRATIDYITRLST